MCVRVWVRVCWCCIDSHSRTVRSYVNMATEEEEYRSGRLLIYWNWVFESQTKRRPRITIWTGLELAESRSFYKPKFSVMVKFTFRPYLKTSSRDGQREFSDAGSRCTSTWFSVLSDSLSSVSQVNGLISLTASITNTMCSSGRWWLVEKDMKLARRNKLPGAEIRTSPCRLSSPKRHREELGWQEKKWAFKESYCVTLLPCSKWKLMTISLIYTRPLVCKTLQQGRSGVSGIFMARLCPSPSCNWRGKEKKRIADVVIHIRV